MKRFLIAAALTLLSVPAMAQERQVYSPYPQPTFSNEEDIQQSQQAAIQQYQKIGAHRVYPGREIYGTSFGNLPRHPGDYRDAVDRGQWTSGGSQRSFPSQ